MPQQNSRGHVAPRRSRGRHRVLITLAVMVAMVLGSFSFANMAQADNPLPPDHQDCTRYPGSPVGFGWTTAVKVPSTDPNAPAGTMVYRVHFDASCSSVPVDQYTDFQLQVNAYRTQDNMGVNQFDFDFPEANDGWGVTLQVLENGSPVNYAYFVVRVPEPTPVAQPPVAADITADTPENTPSSWSVVDEATPVNDPIVLTPDSIVTQPAAGTARFVSDDPTLGMIEYDPPSDYVGTVMFQYTVTDNGLVSAPATITVNVTSDGMTVVQSTLAQITAQPTCPKPYNRANPVTTRKVTFPKIAGIQWVQYRAGIDLSGKTITLPMSNGIVVRQVPLPGYRFPSGVDSQWVQYANTLDANKCTYHIFIGLKFYSTFTKYHDHKHHKYHSIRTDHLSFVGPAYQATFRYYLDYHRVKPFKTVHQGHVAQVVAVLKSSYPFARIGVRQRTLLIFTDHNRK